MAEEQKKKIDRGGNWRLVAAAVSFAVLAGIGTMLYLRVVESRLRKELTPPAKTMEAVIVAARDLPTGSLISTDTMAVRKVPAAYVESDSITPDQFDSVAGAILTRPLPHGKILSRDYIDLKIPKDFSGTIKDGHRALTIEVDEMNSIAGLLRPGNHVDLFSKLSARSDPAQTQATGEVIIPVLENVLVLATGRRSARPNEDEFKRLGSEPEHKAYNTLTLELTPRQVALLSVAESRGTLIAALRNIDDPGNAQFSKVTLADLFAHAGSLRRSAVRQDTSDGLRGLRKNSKGQLVTRDGVVITDPNVHLDKDGRLVGKNGTILSGKGLHVGADGRLRDADGRVVDTASVRLTKNGTLEDKNGVLVAGKELKKLKNGFYEDSKGRVVTADGKVLSGVTVAPDGTVRTKDGRVLTADSVQIAPDGTVHLLSAGKKDTVAADGTVVGADGKPVTARDMVTVGPDGVVRDKNGKILKGVHMGKDGKLYDAEGKRLSAADVLLASQGLKRGKDGKVVTLDGHPVAAKDLVTVGSDGVVRTKDGKILAGVHMDKDGHLRDKDGHLLTARDIAERAALADQQSSGTVLAGVTATPIAPSDTGETGASLPGASGPYQVEYIIGGGSDGAAKTFMIEVEETTEVKGANE